MSIHVEQAVVVFSYRWFNTSYLYPLAFFPLRKTEPFPYDIRMKLPRPILYIIFFCSGAVGLVYQIIWSRMLYLIFGVSTYSVIAVTSGFMAGLAIGSFLIGKLLRPQTNALRMYGIIELAIGLSAGLTPTLLSFLPDLYRTISQTIPYDWILLLVKFILTFAVILPPTIAMGATLPTIVHYLEKSSRGGKIAQTVSMLYSVNTFGALVGVVITGYVLIESIGLAASAYIGACINLILGILILSLSGKYPSNTKSEHAQNDLSQETSGALHLTPTIKRVLSVFAISGGISMAYEVAWVRLLTPTVGTYVYAFSFILALVLAGIALGSFVTRLFVGNTKRTALAFGVVQLFIGLGGIGSLIATSVSVSFSPFLTQILVILPATIGMGMTFPIVSTLATEGHSAGSFIGKAYAANTVGSMIGPIIAGFILLPLLGTPHTIVFLAVMNFSAAGYLFLTRKTLRTMPLFLLAVALGTISVVLAIRNSPLFAQKTRVELEKKLASPDYVSRFMEDRTAGVIAYRKKDNSDFGLLVDGIGMSVLVDETKLMAHLPILTHQNPKDMLVICFGMGTTYRSALSYNLNVDAVELVPSVPNMFDIFFPDAATVLQNPKGKIIINDGRNFVRTTNKTYDIIQVDPPPPVNASGTTVLYSREFYEDSKRIMKPDGLFLQWMFYGTRADDFRMLVKSFTDAFPYVSLYHSPRRIGIYLIGSMNPIPKTDGAVWDKRLNALPTAKTDATEWGPWDGYKLASLYWGDKSILTNFVGNSPAVTDDRPNTEYFLLRHGTSTFGIARDEVISGEMKDR